MDAAGNMVVKYEYSPLDERTAHMPHPIRSGSVQFSSVPSITMTKLPLRRMTEAALYITITGIIVRNETMVKPRGRDRRAQPLFCRK